MSITGSIRAVIIASTLRADSRTARAAMTRSSSMDRVSRQREEHVVERRAMDGEALHGAAIRIDLVEEGTHLGSAAAGRDVDRARARVGADRARPEGGRGALVGAGVREHEL